MFSRDRTDTCKAPRALAVGYVGYISDLRKDPAVHSCEKPGFSVDSRSDFRPEQCT